MNGSIQPNGKSTKKKSKKFNFVDFLVIILILAIVGTGIYLLSPASFLKNLQSGKEGTLIYTIEIKGVDSEYLAKIEENDAVIDSVTKVSLGTVTTVDRNTKHSVFECRESTENPGTYEGVFAEYPDQYDVIVTITADAEYVPQSGYFVNHRRIAVGEKISLRFPNYVGEGYCISMIRQGFN